LDPATLAIDRLNLTGRVALHDAASHGTLELDDIAFSGDVRSLAGSLRGDGNFNVSGTRYEFRVASGQSLDGRGTRVHLSIEPAARPWSADLDGVLNFEARAPRFEGAAVLAANAADNPTVPRVKAAAPPPPPWRVTARIKADPKAAKFDQVEISYGAEQAALKLSGSADIRFGASPQLHASLGARQLDADRWFSPNPLSSQGNRIGAPIGWLPGLRALMTGVPQPPMPTQIEFRLEQIMLGGRPLQHFVADLHSDTRSWAFDLLDFQAPGATHVELNARAIGFDGLKGSLAIESSDPDSLAAWLRDSKEVSSHSEKPLRLRGNVTVAADRLAIEAMQAEIDGGALEGSVVLSDLPSGGSRLESVLKAERLDLDATASFVRALAGPQARWPNEARLSLDIGHAVSAGQELGALMAKLGYTPATISLDQLKLGDSAGVLVEGSGGFDRNAATGKLALTVGATSIAQISGLMAPFAPALASRLDAVGIGPGPARVKLAIDIDKVAARADLASARAVFDLDAPQFKGVIRVSAKPAAAALRGVDLQTLSGSDVSLETRLTAEHGRALVLLLGLDHVIAVGAGPAQLDATIDGAWKSPLRLQARLSGAGLDADTRGNLQPWAAERTASIDLRVHGASLAPLFGLKPSDGATQTDSLSSHISLTGNRLSFEDLDGAWSGSRLRGHVALSLDDERNLDGVLKLDALDLGNAVAQAIGAAGHDAAEPVGAGWLTGWHGQIGFVALRGILPGGSELRPVSGSLKSDGQSLTIDDFKGGIGGGDVTASLEARQSANAVILNARVQLTGADGTALRYRALAMPAGRVSMQMTLASQGRSASALVGGLSGSGTVMLDSARIPGLDPRVFEIAIRASDTGQATTDTRLRQIVEPGLSAGALSVKSAQIPFTIRDGRLRVGATALDADGARAMVSGGYDFPADQADLRAVLASTAAGPSSSRPEIQLFMAGSPDALNRTIDVASLSSWLAVRAIDRETRRLDALERGEPPPGFPASVPAQNIPSHKAADPALSEPTSASPNSNRELLSPPLAASGLIPPVVSQQVAPLPPPIEIKPVPGSVSRPPKLKPPLALVPPTNTPPR
jgi:large subunit ribosomal protein L24